jgi:TadE-like protein
MPAADPEPSPRHRAPPSIPARRGRRAAWAGRARGSAGSARASHGQATVELVALLPVIAALLVALWQAALAGHAAWAANAAARAAARAHAVGADPRRAAREHLPGSLEPGLRVKAHDDGEVELSIRVPRLPGVPALGRARATARFAPQS